MTEERIKLHNERFNKATAKQLTIQGLSLHYASMWGPLRTSKQFRKEHPNWVNITIKRWLNEFGLNLALIVMIIIAGALLTHEISPWLILTAFLISPALTVIQMFIDNYTRKDITVLYDTETRTGLTIRKSSPNSFAFYNHYALPIGNRNGKHIRNHIHTTMKTSKKNLDCTAQNRKVADHYLKENTGGKDIGGAKPKLTWEYSQTPTQTQKESLISKLLGMNNTRNSGQLPKPIKY